MDCARGRVCGDRASEAEGALLSDIEENITNLNYALRMDSGRTSVFTYWLANGEEARS